MEYARSGLVALLLMAGTAAQAQHPVSPDHCGAELVDLADIIACARLGDEGRIERCAAAREQPLLPPTDGARVLEFGARAQYGSTSKGVVFSGGAKVVAPSAGRVLFGGAFRSYGNLVIIDACTYDVLIAGVETVGVAAHSFVESGQTIGTTAGPGAVIYLEVRKGHQAVDPFGIR